MIKQLTNPQLQQYIEDLNNERTPLEILPISNSIQKMRDALRKDKWNLLFEEHVTHIQTVCTKL